MSEARTVVATVATFAAHRHRVVLKIVFNRVVSVDSAGLLVDLHELDLHRWGSTSRIRKRIRVTLARKRHVKHLMAIHEFSILVHSVFPNGSLVSNDHLGPISGKVDNLLRAVSLVSAGKLLLSSLPIPLSLVSPLAKESFFVLLRLKQQMLFPLCRLFHLLVVLLFRNLSNAVCDGVLSAKEPLVLITLLHLLLF